VATLAYGSITTLSRLAYDDGATPITLIALRSALFVLALGAFLAFARGGLDLPRRAWYASALLALFMGLWGYGYLASVAYIPVSLAALLFFTFPLLVGLLAAVTGQDRLTPLKAIALLVAFVGLALALGPSWETLDWRGVALVLMASVVSAIAYVFIAPVFRQHDIVAVNFLAHLWMVIGFALYGFAMRDFALPRSTDGQFLAMAVMLFYVLAYSLWSLAIAWIGPVRTAGMMNLEPVVSLAVAALVLGERLTPIQLGGGALVLLALVLVARAPAPRRRR
jgi:drug/metabolite transporter (DMT)-like permease